MDLALYVMADTHLSFSSGKPMDVFGGRWQDHSEKIKKGWNSVVGEKDTVIVPGDISWGLTVEEAEEDLVFLNGLNGKKVLLKGNHDFWWQSIKKNNEFFEKKELTTLSILQNDAIYCEGKIVCGSRGWFYDPKASPDNTDPIKISAREAIRTEMSIKAGLELKKTYPDAELIAFFHFPPVFRDFVCRDIVDLLHKYEIDRCYYGHIHGVYDIPRTISFENIAMTIASADYLHFIPLLVV